MARVPFAKGAQGEIIRRMQLQLGLGAEGADGVFGGDTFKAVTAFQKTKGLDPTGEVDAATYEIRSEDGAGARAGGKEKTS